MTQPITVSETARKLHSLIERLTEKIISVARAQRDGAASDEFEKGWDSCAESIEHQVRESGENTRLHLALTAALEEIERLKGALLWIENVDPQIVEYAQTKFGLRITSALNPTGDENHD